jgi:hypothetical protein
MRKELQQFLHRLRRQPTQVIRHIALSLARDRYNRYEPTLVKKFPTS